MQYIEKFSSQWDKLISDFTAEIGQKSTEEITAEAADKWYRIRIHRWNSIVETEGLVLEHENDPKLKEALLAEMGSFSFAQPKPCKKPGFMPRIVIGAILIVLLSVLPVILFDMGKIKAMLAALLIIAGISAEYSSSSGSARKKEKEDIMKAYTEQLRELGKRLAEICRTRN